MKPILYQSNETAFDTNGIGILADEIDTTVIETLNGKYELEMKYPINGIHFLDIRSRSNIMAKPDPVSEPQPFRVYRITKPMNGQVTIYARHIAYDMMGIPVAPFGASGAGIALQGLKTYAAVDCPFEFWTDIEVDGDMAVAVPTSMWTLLGSSEGSVLDVFGGEYEFDRYAVRLWKQRGADRGVSIRYGKNLTSLEQDENCSNCHTGVYPYWTNSDGALVQLAEKVVEASGKYDFSNIIPLDLSNEWEEAPTEEQLRERAEAYIEENDIGTPAVSWKVEFAQLEQTEEYKGMALLERVLLGDTVSVEFAEMGVSASARAVEKRYKPVLERYESITLGSVRPNLATTIAQQQKKLNEKPDRTQMQIAIEILTAAILGATGGSVRLLDTNGDGMLDTLYVADNPDPNKAVKVWRFNYKGWGGSKTGYSGPFIMGATLEDGFLADFITAGTLNAALVKVINIIADNIVSGKLMSSDKSMVIDLDTNSIYSYDPSKGYIGIGGGFITRHDSGGKTRMSLHQFTRSGSNAVTGVDGHELVFADKTGFLVGAIGEYNSHMEFACTDLDISGAGGSSTVYHKIGWKTVNGVKTLVAYD